MCKVLKISENLRKLLQKIESSSVIASCILDSTKEGHNLTIIENGIDYLSISEADSSKISYLNCDRMASIDETNYWISRKRYHILPGKVISKLFDKTILIKGIITSKDIEIFSNVYRSCQIENKVKFEIVKGNDIKRYYYQESYSRNADGELCGSLGGSCMRHDRCQNYFSLYTENKEVSLLCLFDKDTNCLIGRSILWNIEAEEISTGKKLFKIMDRIYTINDDFYTIMFKNWAKNNGYFYKSEQNHNNSVWFDQDSKKIDLYLSINLNTNFKNFPYLDTFKFIDIDSSTLYNYPVGGVSKLKIMNSVEGWLESADSYCLDEITRISYHIENTIQLPYLNNIRVYKGNTFLSNIHNCYILRSHVMYDQDLDDYIFNEEYDKFNDHKKIEERFRYLKGISSKKEMIQSLRFGSFYDNDNGEDGDNDNDEDGDHDNDGYAEEASTDQVTDNNIPYTSLSQMIRRQTRADIMSYDLQHRVMDDEDIIIDRPSSPRRETRRRVIVPETPVVEVEQQIAELIDSNTSNFSNFFGNVLSQCFMNNAPPENEF